MRFNPKRKFNNKKIESPDGVFDSKLEWQRWLFLKDAEKNGQIRDLKRQVKFTLIPTQYRTEIVQLKTKRKQVQRVAEREITYTADFTYRKLVVEQDYPIGEREYWGLVVEDAKGYPNDRWPLKKSMMLYFHGISVREVKKATEPI
jgi:hypothetical protein